MKLSRVALAVVLGATLLRAQGKSPHADKTLNTLHVTTQLVVVNVIAKDRHGHPVKGLTRDDFTVLDNGSPQKLSIFQVEETRAAQEGPAKLPPGTYSNLPARAAGAAPAVTVILLDALNTPWEDQVWSRGEVVKFLEQMQPGDRVALYGLGRELRVLHDFTTDASTLLQALGIYRERIASELASSEPQQSSEGLLAMGGRAGAEIRASNLAQFMDQSEQRMEDFYVKHRARLTVRALLQIAVHLQGFPGRKNLIWVSGSFPMGEGLARLLNTGSFTNQQVYGPEVEGVARALSYSDLAVYPVDARGLMTLGRYSALQHRRRDTRSMGADFAVMDVLAERTGGRAYYNTNNVRGALRRVLDDSRLNYVLGYYPRSAKWKGEYRKIKVEVHQPGVHLQYRRGYVALPEEQTSTESDDRLMNAAVISPIEATAIGLTVRLFSVTAKETPPGGSQQSYSLQLDLHVDLRDVSHPAPGVPWDGSLTLLLAEVGPKGDVLHAVSHKLALNIPAQVQAKLLEQGFDARENLQAAAGAETLRVVVRDDSTGNLGSVDVPLAKVIPAAAPHDGPPAR